MGQPRVPTPETDAVPPDAVASRQEIDLTTRLDAERLGAVAFHSGRMRNARAESDHSGSYPAAVK